MDATFFATPQAFRVWLTKHAGKESELIVGFHKKGSGTPSLTWPEAVDEALCVGWIDGVRKNIDAERYQIRFTPRKATSIWSAVNIGRVAALTAEKRMQPAGLAAFQKRQESRSRTYAYEQATDAALTAADEKAFKRNKPAWAHFNTQAPSYRRRMVWWIVSAKQQVTRDKRLAQLVAASHDGLRL